MENLDYPILLLFIILFIILVLINEYIDNKFEKIKPEINRKLVHILAGILFIISSFFLTQMEIIILAIASLGGAIITKLSGKFDGLYGIERVTFGNIIYPISIIFLAYFYLPNFRDVFIFAILIIALADAFAAVAGSFVPKKIPFFKKTFLGSFTFFITTLIISFFTFKNNNFWQFFSSSILLTIVEFLFIYGFDNIALAIASSQIFYYFNY